ncbi:MAG: hypothetical protein HRU69_11890 [Flammeovirgaceae bacterium]|nr:MAG: hypothetical protein HRU69_11890 [Flammeovirgaceae bacterium]
MRKIGLWIDSREALIVSFENGRLSHHRIFSGIESKPRYKGESSRKSKRAIGFDYETSQQAHYNEWLKKYIQSVVDILRGSSAVIYITGPGTVRITLENALRKVRNIRVLKNDALGHLTEARKIEAIRQFFESVNG